MPIMGLEAVVYGVDDVDTAARFLSDFGLETRDSGVAGATLAVAGEGTRVELRKLSDTSLPEAVEAGPTLREIVWAVSDKAALQDVAGDLAPRPQRHRGQGRPASRQRPRWLRPRFRGHQSQARDGAAAALGTCRERAVSRLSKGDARSSRPYGRLRAEYRRDGRVL